MTYEFSDVTDDSDVEHSDTLDDSIDDESVQKITTKKSINQIKSKKNPDIDSISNSDLESNGSNIFEVEKILDHAQKPQGLFYYVKWKDYDIDQSSWEHEENLVDCNQVIRQYWRYAFSLVDTRSGKKRKH